MTAVAVIAVFPVLTLLLIGLVKLESLISQAASVTSQRLTVDPPLEDENPSE